MSRVGAAVARAAGTTVGTKSGAGLVLGRVGARRPVRGACGRHLLRVVGDDVGVVALMVFHCGFGRVQLLGVAIADVGDVVQCGRGVVGGQLAGPIDVEVVVVALAFLVQVLPDAGIDDAQVGVECGDFGLRRGSGFGEFSGYGL